MPAPFQAAWPNSVLFCFIAAMAGLEKYAADKVIDTPEGQLFDYA